MSRNIQWYTERVDMPAVDCRLMALWLQEVASSHGRRLGALNYIFCNDDRILEVNREFLRHDYYTDIITFDYSRGLVVSGDMYISLDTVASNAEGLGCGFMQELHRVIVHGVLHLCGIDDKGPGEREIMEANEDRALEMLRLMSLKSDKNTDR